MTNQSQKFESVCQIARDAALFHSSADALEWDERTGMPAKAGKYRADQIARLRTTAHELRTGKAYGEMLGELVDSVSDTDPHGDEAATVTHLHRDYCRDQKLPTELVTKLARATVAGQQAWDSARGNNSFAEFRDSLKHIIDLKRESAQRLAEGTDKSPYEALLDEYEPDARIADLAPMFADLKTRLIDLIRRTVECSSGPDVSILRRDFPIEKQRQLSLAVAKSVGFDFDAGRLDETSHPFCTTLGPRDCRILTRYELNLLPSGLYSTLHEAGHGMYEQGLREQWFGLPPGSYLSLGMHESQSRLWENQVGRSEAFCDWLYPQLQRLFPDALDSVSLRQFYEAINAVQPSLIRVEADEVTYNLHILIRFELEQQILDGSLEVDDLPAAWNQQYESVLGIVSETEADGVLQDVHWSAGLIGYFPTYTLGNLMAAQLFDAAEEQISDLSAQIQRGEFHALLEWLRKHIHQHGRCFNGNQLIEQATGKPLSADPMINYLNGKLTGVYKD